MRKNLGFVIAVTGSTLAALSLTGSTQIPANTLKIIKPFAAAQIARSRNLALQQYDSGNFLEARAVFIATAALAEKAGSNEMAANSLSNAGAAALARFSYRDALGDFGRAGQAARAAHLYGVLATISNNLASLYLRLGDHELAIQVATQALAGPLGTSARTVTSGLEYQLATALGESGRFSEALPIYGRAITRMEEDGDLEAAARALASLGFEALKANSEADAEAALTEALRLVRTHNLNAAANVLRLLARLKNRQGDLRSASALFDRAVEARQSLTPRWILYADRGEFRLVHDNLPGALADFREARRLTALLRVDMVPADQDRIAADNNLSRVALGLVEAGNRLVRKAADKRLLEETFDAAESDRLWSLRSLLPALNDWRTRLPERYWDRLAQYQKIELSLLSKSSVLLQTEVSALSRDLQAIEANAGGDRAPPEADHRSPLSTIRDRLDNDTLFLSFHLSERGSWIWAADRHRVDAWPIPPLSQIKASVAAFTSALKSGAPEADALGLRLYRQLFASVTPSYLKHSRWLLELDGPLFDLPFAALVVSDGIKGPVYLVERATLQAIPGAMMMQRQPDRGNEQLLEIGDAIYNSADNRYKGRSAPDKAITLPRLPATAAEMKSCALAWGESHTRILSGTNAGQAQVAEALRSNPAVIHFATHVITGPGEFASGLIALSLDNSGAMGLLGPKEIIAHPVTASLVVLNGCHSAQGQTIPGAGLMGLTRAWIGAGAGAVLATRWDIADDAGEAFMANFYRELHAHWDRGPSWALQQAQLHMLRDKNRPGGLNLLGAYFLLGRA